MRIAEWNSALRIPHSAICMDAPLTGLLERNFKTLQSESSGVRALVVIGSNGEVLAHAEADTDFSPETFAFEHATLIRIVQRTAEDTGMGDVNEHVLVSETAVIVARRLSPDHFAICFSRSQDQLGRLRYELKRATRTLERRLKGS